MPSGTFWEDNGASHPGISNNSIFMADVNHQGASGWTRWQQGTTLSAVFIPRGENIAAGASLRIGLSQQNDPLPPAGPVALSVD